MVDSTSLAVSSATVTTSSAKVKASPIEMGKPEGGGGVGSSDTLNEISEHDKPEDENETRVARKALDDAQDATLQMSTQHPRKDQQQSGKEAERARSESPDSGTISDLDSKSSTDSKELSESGHHGIQRSFTSTSETLPVSSAPTSAYSLRDRGAKQKRLVYDLKYHPMDDRTRPTHAAKRRLAYGEHLPSSDDSSDCFSVQTDADTQPHSDDSFEGASTRQKRVSRQSKHDKKRTRKRSRSPPVPTRRSARRVSEEKKFYNMSMHPQDKDLELLSSDDEEVSMSFPKRRKTTPKKCSDSDATVLTGSKSKSVRSRPIIVSSESGQTSTDQEDGIMAGDTFDTIMQMDPKEVLHVNDTRAKSTSPTPSIPTPVPHGVRRRESLDVWKLMPGERYFRHDRDSWPYTLGLPFDIWDEQKEGQVAEDAMTGFPLNFEHDDKENQLDSTDQHYSDPHEGITVIPASQYRGLDGSASAVLNSGLAREALYEERRLGSDTYGFSADGAYDENAMRPLASGAHLPQETFKNKPGSD
ncbi:hypothetical protein NX059_000580 [Plenodomus lindquistii]|nr:hypothetical protein NX059_000580 [Plenodomus lindquistii]